LEREESEGLKQKWRVARRGTQQVLAEAFAQSAFATGERRAALAVSAGITEHQVKNFFQNKRQRMNQPAARSKGGVMTTTMAAAADKENAAVTPKRLLGNHCGKVAFGASANLNTPAAAASASPKSITKWSKTPGSHMRLPDAVRQVGGPL
jgi:hypothetical protein